MRKKNDVMKKNDHATKVNKFDCDLCQVRNAFEREGIFNNDKYNFDGYFELWTLTAMFLCAHNWKQ
jgi:hypothetical protein